MTDSDHERLALIREDYSTAREDADSGSARAADLAFLLRVVDELQKTLETIAEYCEAEGSPLALSVAKTARNAGLRPA